MKIIVEKIEQTIAACVPMIRSFDPAVFQAKPRPEKWSKSEILGHLVDSAQNNIQRFVRGQYEEDPKIIYQQDEWVRIQHYADYDRDDLIQLWMGLNKHLCRVLLAMDSGRYENTCDIGKEMIELHTLRFLAEDYLAHMKHHLKQIQ
jgi:DinB superfamily